MSWANHKHAIFTYRYNYHESHITSQSLFIVELTPNPIHCIFRDEFELFCINHLFICNGGGPWFLILMRTSNSMQEEIIPLGIYVLFHDRKCMLPTCAYLWTVREPKCKQQYIFGCYIIDALTECETWNHCQYLELQTSELYTGSRPVNEISPNSIFSLGPYLFIYLFILISIWWV